MGNGDEFNEATPPPPAVPANALPTEAELRKRFYFHPPRDEAAIARHKEVSDLTFNLAEMLCAICYPGRQLSLALTALEEVRMRANASIACDDPRP